MPYYLAKIFRPPDQGGPDAPSQRKEGKLASTVESRSVRKEADTAPQTRPKEERRGVVGELPIDNG